MRLFIAWCLAVLGSALIYVNDATAGYAQLAPPPGITSVGGVSTIPVGAAANGARYAGGHVLANASLNVGARTVTVPVAMRVAANAGTFAATRLNPWVAGLVLAASAIPFVTDWLDDTHAGSKLLDYIYDPETNEIIKKPINGFTPPPELSNAQLNLNGIDVSKLVDANGNTAYGYIATIQNWGSCQNMTGSMSAIPISSCPGGTSGVHIEYCVVTTPTAGGYFGGFDMCHNAPSLPQIPAPVKTRATADQWAQIAADLAATPVNPALLPEIGLPIPIDPTPVINPSTQPSGDVLVGPLGNPAPQLQPSAQPLRYPDGDPVPNPNTSPQTYTQPWNEVWPSPTPSEPWRVDIRPTTTIVNSPTPAPDPVPNPVPNPGTSNPSTGTGQTDCEKFPNSLGCVPIGTPPDIEVPKQTKTITLQDGPAFGGSGSCPASVYVTAGGQSVKAINMEQACGFISNYMRPLVLALAFLSAVMIVLPRE